MELSTYFRINAANTGQFERTLIVADDESYVSYLEGCTAPMRDENQLHAALSLIHICTLSSAKRFISTFRLASGMVWSSSSDVYKRQENIFFVIVIN